MQFLSVTRRALALSLLCSTLVACGGGDDDDRRALPAEIQQIFAKPEYRNSVWGLRVVDLEDGRVLHDLHSDRQLLIGSVRKIFSVGAALDALGADHVFRTPVYRQGTVAGNGVLTGNLVLMASGDLTMGGRRNADGTLAISRYDHNEANGLGNAELTTPDPLAGFNALAAQVAAAGIRQVNGDVVIDDRLFEPFDFRGEFKISPIFVNDNVVDVIIDRQAGVDWRPKSAALTVQSALQPGPSGSPLTLQLDPELPGCIGTTPCVGTVSGRLPSGFVPPFTNAYPLIRTFRIVEPANYARTVFIEALARAGVTVSAPAVARNPVQALPARGSYLTSARVAELVSHRFEDEARLTMKVSYNIGADLSTMLFGLTKGATTFPAALAAEIDTLATRFAVPVDQVHFIDGSGGGDTTATNTAVTRMLEAMAKRPSAAVFKNLQPRLGVDGSLSFVTDFAADPTLAGARGNVYGKTGTYVTGVDGRAFYKAQSLAGYIDTKGGRRLAFAMAVNDVDFLPDINDVIPVFQDQGTVAAILWKLH